MDRYLTRYAWIINSTIALQRLTNVGDFIELRFPRVMALDKTTVTCSFEELVVWRLKHNS